MCVYMYTHTLQVCPLKKLRSIMIEYIYKKCKEFISVMVQKQLLSANKQARFLALTDSFVTCISLV